MRAFMDWAFGDAVKSHLVSLLVQKQGGISCENWPVGDALEV